MKIFPCAVLSLIAGGFSFNVSANEPENLTVDIDTTSSVTLRQIEVVGNRATAKTPVAFTNIRKSELTRANDGRDMTYLLQMTPSVTVSSDAGAGVGYTSIRVRGSDGSRINVTANGVPVNNPESHNVYWVNMPDLASSLRDVQIQRGAGTSSNGAGAFGASVNMMTDTPSFVPYAELSGSYGMYNTNRETLRVGTGLLGDHWSADLRLSHLGSDGYIDRASTKLWSYFGQVAFRADGTLLRLLSFGGKERTYMAWDYASLEDMEKYGRRYNPCGEYTDSQELTAYYPDQYDNYAQYHFHLLLSQRLADDFHLNAAAHYTLDDGYYDQYKTRRTLAEYGLSSFIDSEGETVSKSDLIRLKKNHNHFGGGYVNANYAGENIDITLGVASTVFYGKHFGQVKWVRNYLGPLDPLQPYYENVGHKADASVYLRANYDFDSRFSAFADMQYRHIRYTIHGSSDNFDGNTGAPYAMDVNRRWNFFNPNLGVNFTEGPHRAYASWAIARREPTRDNFTDGEPGRRPEAERLNDFEAGYVFSNRIFSAGVNLYYMLYKDQLVATGELSDTGNPVSVNVPDSYRMGMELQLGAKPWDWFDWNFSLTLSHNRIKNFVEYIYEEEWTNPIEIPCGDTPIAFSPSLTFANSFKFHFRKFDAELQTRYTGRQNLTNAGDDAPYLKPYCVSDLHLSYLFGNFIGLKEMKVGFSIYNVLNHKYFSNGYAGAGYYLEDERPVIYRYAGYAAQAPAHVMATLSLKF